MSKLQTTLSFYPDFTIEKDCELEKGKEEEEEEEEEEEGYYYYYYYYYYFYNYLEFIFH